MKPFLRRLTGGTAAKDTRLAAVGKPLMRARDNANIGERGCLTRDAPGLPIDVLRVIPGLRRHRGELLRLIAASDEAAAEQRA